VRARHNVLVEFAPSSSAHHRSSTPCSRTSDDPSFAEEPDRPHSTPPPETDLHPADRPYRATHPPRGRAMMTLPPCGQPRGCLSPLQFFIGSAKNNPCRDTGK
jgi:hypothetical protein